MPSLTSLRWYAALLVFFVHVDFVPFQWTPLNPFEIGYVGVAFFFVLSGFVLTWSSAVVVRSGRFYWRRFARIYPAHIATFAIVGLAAVAWHLPKVGYLSALMNITLTQAWWPGYRMVETWNGVSWSLSAEAFFYLCFPAILIWVRRATPRAAACVVFGALIAGLAAMLVLRHTFGLNGGATAYFNPLCSTP